MATMFAATAVAAIVVPLTAVHTNGHRAEVVVAGPSTSTNSLSSNGFSIPSSITVSGTSIPYVGNIPWANAVTPTAHSTTLTIYADGDKAGHCSLPIERVLVHQDAGTVVVLVAGYAQPLPTGTACAGVGHGPQPLTVDLRAPLGERHLVDAYDQVTHPLLIASTLPTLAGIPSGYEEEPVRWQDQTGQARRTWMAGGLRTTSEPVPQSMITLTRTPAARLEKDLGPAAGALVASDVPVAGGVARVWSYSSRYEGYSGLQVTVRWTSFDGHDYELLTSTWSGGLGVPQAEALARAVH